MTVNSQNEIQNSALVLLGQRPATSPSEQTKASQFVTDRYETIRDFILANGNWNCATTRAQLSVLSTAPAFGFANQYQLPNDFIRLVRFGEGLEDLDVQFRIEAKSNGDGSASRVLLTDFSTADIVYVFRLTEVAKMDELLKYAISARLAYEISLAVKGDIQQTRLLKIMSDEATSLGQYSDAVQAPVEIMGGSQWLQSRVAGGGGFRSIANVTS